MTQTQAVLLSIAIEVPCVVAWVRGRRLADAPVGWLVLLGAAATALTHPFVWHGTPAMASWIPSWPVRVAITEIGAWLVEAAVYRWKIPLSWRSALTVSGLANAASFGFGLIWLTWVVPWLAS